MKKILFFLISIFILTTSSFGAYCYNAQQSWKTGGISACTFGNGLNGVGLQVMHYLSDDPNPNATCKTRAFVCENREGTQTPAGASNLPNYVNFNPNPESGDYPYSCGTNTTTFHSIFSGAYGEGFYSCSSGFPVHLENVETINPNNPDNPITCKDGYSSFFHTGFTVIAGKKSFKEYEVFSCVSNNGSNIVDSDNLDDISEKLKESSQNNNVLQTPSTTTNDDGSKTFLYPDGTKQTIYENGTLITEYPNGDKRVDKISDLKPNETGKYIKYQYMDSQGNKFFQTSDGIKYLLEPNGDLTKSYGGVILTEKVDYNTWKPSQNHGFSSQTGTGSGSGLIAGTGSGSSNGSSNDKYVDGTNIGDTSNESGKGGEIPEIEEKEEDAKSCNDPNLTYQQKMFCEINKGFRKINQEDNPEMSINNMLATYNETMNRNEKAIIHNLHNTAISSGKTILLQEEYNENLAKLSETSNLSNSIYSSLSSGVDVLKNNLSRLFPSLKNQNNNSGQVGGGSSGSENSINLDEYFAPSENENNGQIGGTDETSSNIDSLITQYSTFSDNLGASFNSINNQIKSAINSIRNIENNIINDNVFSCSISYSFDLSSYNLGQKYIDFDICKYSSKLYSFGYFVIYLLSMLFLLNFTFNSIRKLIK